MNQIFILVVFAINLFAQKVFTVDDVNTIKNIVYDKKSKQPINGFLKTYYENGNLRFEIQYKKGKRESISKGYYKKGKLRFEIQYKNGKREGLAKAYYKNGNPKAIVNFKNDYAVTGINFSLDGIIETLSKEKLEKMGYKIKK